MKQRVLFVDDEPGVLQGLQRMLRPLRNEWDMAFAGSGPEALDHMARAPVDVVVSDLRMPGMDGAQLLNEVMRRHPAVVRIVLSGQASPESVLHALVPTHQYLAKPCEPDTLKATVARVSVSRSLLSDATLRTLVAGTGTLPSLPSLFCEVTEALNAPNAALQTVSQIIAKDIGMTAKILQVVNSAFFGCHHRMCDVTRAVSLLGLDIIKSLVFSLNLFSQCTETQLSRFPLHTLWDHGVTLATYARRIAQAEQQESSLCDAAFTAGLLHDCGSLVFAVNLPDAYAQVLARVQEHGRPVWEVERETFGVSHAQVGACLLGLWGLPDPIIEALAWHHEPGQCRVQKFSPLTAVHVADVLAHQQVEPHTAPRVVDSQYLARLGLSDRLPVWQEQGAVLIPGGHRQ